MSKSGRDAIVNEVIEAARSATMTSKGIEQLSARLAVLDDPSGAIDRALDAAGPDAAARLMLAAATADRPPTTEQVGQVLPVIDSIEHLPVLVGCASGDRVEMLLDAVESGQMSSQRDALALFLAVELLSGEPPTPRLLTQIRLVSRHCRDTESRLLLGLAAQGIDDPDAREVLADFVAMAAVIGGDEMATRLRRLLQGPPARVLPEHPPPKTVAGFTVRRPAAKVGRNAPCPCGSGKKYKKCCMKTDQARLSDPSPVAGLTMSEYVARAGEHMDIAEFNQLRPREMRDLDLEELPTLHLIAAVRKFVAFAFWPDAERAMEVLAHRDDLPCKADEYREELIGEALNARAFEVARRQADLLDEPSELYSTYRLGIELAESDAELLAHLEEAARLSLEEDADDPLCVPYALLPVYPALGILAARSCLDPARALDSEVLLEAVEEARDRLQLPPGDPAGARYDLLADRHYDELIEAAQAESMTAQNESLLAEVTALRQRLDESVAKSRSLEHSLQQAAARLAEAERSSGTAGREPRPASGTERTAGADTEALRRKVEDLKGLIGQGNEDRAALRKHLANLRDKLSAADKGPAAREGAVPDESDDGLEIESEAPERLTVLIPKFTDRAESAIHEAPQPLARAAVHVVSGLAGGEENRWKGVKHLRTVPGLYSARVGIHHRLLFELAQEAGRLVVREFIHRSELEKVVSRYR